MRLVRLALLAAGLLGRFVGQRAESFRDLFTLARRAERLAELLQLSEVLLIDLEVAGELALCLLYTSPSPRDRS